MIDKKNKRQIHKTNDKKKINKIEKESSTKRDIIYISIGNEEERTKKYHVLCFSRSQSPIHETTHTHTHKYGSILEDY